MCLLKRSSRSSIVVAAAAALCDGCDFFGSVFLRFLHRCNLDVIVLPEAKYRVRCESQDPMRKIAANDDDDVHKEKQIVLWL